METFSALLGHCGGNSPVTGEFPSQRPLTRSFDVFFDLRLKTVEQTIETPVIRDAIAFIMTPLWRHMYSQWPPSLCRLCIFGNGIYAHRLCFIKLADTYNICLLLLISMLWHRQAIFESKGDKLSSSAESRIRTHQGLRHQIASRLNAHWQTDWAIEDQAKKLELDSPSLWSASIQPTWPHSRLAFAPGSGDIHVCCC